MWVFRFTMVGPSDNTISRGFIFEIRPLKVLNFYVKPALEQVRIMMRKTASFMAYCFECCHYALDDANLMSF